MFNTRNKLCLQKFKIFTNNTDKFTKCFASNEAFEVQFKRWQTLFQKALHANFRKIRRKDDDPKKVNKLDILINKKKEILKKKNPNITYKEEIDLIDREISEECEEKDLEKLNSFLGSLESQDSNIYIWKQMRKLYPKKVKPLPTGLKNLENKVITNPKEKKHVIIEHFTHRMRKRPSKN